MKEESDIRIAIGKQRVVTLPELYAEYDRTHKIQAELSFEDKIKVMVDLQKMAFSWGKRRDVIVWRIETT